MRLKRILLMLMLVVGMHVQKAKAQFITFGPQVHYYFGNANHRLTLGFEAAFYLFFKLDEYPQAWSLDVGVELGRTKVIYSEVQMMVPSYLYFGASAGMYRKFQQDMDAVTGFQFTGWGGLFLLPDVRYRIDKRGQEFGCGTFLKIPVPTKVYIF